MNVLIEIKIRRRLDSILLFIWWPWITIVSARSFIISSYDPLACEPLAQIECLIQQGMHPIWGEREREKGIPATDSELYGVNSFGAEGARTSLASIYRGIPYTVLRWKYIQYGGDGWARADADPKQENWKHRHPPPFYFLFPGARHRYCIGWTLRYRCLLAPVHA